MTIGSWILVGFLLTCIATGGGLAFWRFYKASHIAWKPLPGLIGVMWFSKAADTIPSDIVNALKASVQLLSMWTKWPGEDIGKLVLTMKIYVEATPTWGDGYGRKVAGLQAQNVIYVGSDLAAMCHELAHLCELKLDLFIDDAHEGWVKNGIQRAVDEFDLWLRKVTPL